MKFKSNIEVQAGLEDASGSPGTVNQLLSSTVTGTAWIDPSTIVAEAATVVVIACKNTSGATIAKGTPVYQTGTVGATATIEIAPADALISTGDLPAIGLLQTTLNNNGFGFVVISGALTSFTTSPIDGVVPVTGDKVFLKSGGGLTLTKPTGATNGIQNLGLIGKVSGGNSGTITVSSIMRANDVPNLPEGRIWVGDGNTLVSDTVYVDEPNLRLGVGTITPSEALEVNGNIKASAIQLTTGAADTYVLTSDASGNASWAAASGGGVGPDTVGVTELKPELKDVDIPMTSTTSPYGDASFTTPGATTWTAPAGVTSVSVVCVGGGGGGTGGSSSTSGGGGGALGWKNSITVVPGTTYNVQVGSGGAVGSYGGNGTAGGESYFVSNVIAQADGGDGGQQTYTNRVIATYIGDGGGDGGLTGSGGAYASGGGGAGGYSGNGGSSTNVNYANGEAGLGGGGGAGGNCGSSDSAGSGGGVGLLGEGASGTGGTGSTVNAFGGVGGSGGANGTNGDLAGGCFGGDYGGGGGSADNSTSSEYGVGGQGAVRIIWGSGRSFPSTDTGTGGTANDNVDIDWSLGIQTDVYTMTADTDFTFSNLQAGKTITIRITGAFTPTLPSGLNTDWYNGSEINHIQVYCADSSTPTFVKLFPEASPFAVATPSLRGTPSTASGVGASLTLSPPALFPAGDLMIIVARTGYADANYATSTLAGWTKLVTGGAAYARSVIFYKISTGTETAVTITSTGQSSSSYQHPSGIWASFKDCVGIGASTDYFSDTAAYTTQTIAGVTGSADSLEVCVMAAGTSTSSNLTWGISGGSWALESSVVNTTGFYYGGCAIATVPGGSPSTSPSAITIDTSNAMIRQQAMLRLVGAW